MAFLSSIITTIILVLLNAVVLTLLSRKFGLGDRSYLTAFVITSVHGIFLFLLNLLSPLISLIVTLPLGFYLIMWKYALSPSQALKVWALWFVFSMVAGVIAGAVAGFISLIY